MLRFAVAALVVACFAAPVRAEPHTPPRQCQTLESSRVQAKAFAEQHGWGYIELDGKDAQGLWDIINAIPPVTTFRSDHLGIYLSIPTGRALVIRDDGPCGGYMTGVALPLVTVIDAYRKVRGLVDPPKPGRDAI